MPSLPLALVLDDRPSRHRLITRELSGQFEIVSVFGPEEAIDLLLNPDKAFAFVTLDFMLGHPYLDGLSVVERLAEEAENPAVLHRLKMARWRVHSMDSMGGPQMVAVLRQFLGRQLVQDHFPLP